MIGSKIKVFFFDFDGTLVDSVPILRIAYFALLKDRGFEGSEEEFQKLNGVNRKEIIHTLKTTYPIEESEEELENQFTNELKRIYAEEIKLYPGVQEVLRCAYQKHFRLYIVTSASVELVSALLEKFRIRHFFQKIISADGLTNGKPHPEIYKNALKVATCYPDEVIAFEDSQNGIRSATAAGITARQIRTPSDWHQVLQELNTRDEER